MNTVERVSEDGLAIIPDLLAPEEVDSLLLAIDNQASGTTRSGGIRNLLDRCPKVDEFAESPAVRGLVEPILGRAAFAARAILFDKTPETNWKVPWHQDLTIAVQDKVEVTGYGPWSTKDGVAHVQPPVAILEAMLAVRIHLDDLLRRKRSGPSCSRKSLQGTTHCRPDLFDGGIAASGDLHCRQGRSPADAAFVVACLVGSQVAPTSPSHSPGVRFVRVAKWFEMVYRAAAWTHRSIGDKGLRAAPCLFTE
jgi:hypothetical protein